jgi:pilus assembly protein CpaF
VRKPSYFALGTRIGNCQERAFANFTPTANKFAAQFGEVRGPEAFDLLQLLNTGHEGTLSTIHASSAKQALARFTSCVLQSGIDLPHKSVKSNLADSLNVVIHIERRPGRRFVSEVLEINGYDPDADLFDLSPVYRDARVQG